MRTDEARVTENTILPGWETIQQKGKSTKYRAPDGNIVSYYGFRSAATHYKNTGIVPQSPLGTRWKSYQEQHNASFSGGKRDRSIIDADPHVSGEEGSDDAFVLDLPEPRPTPGKRTSSGLFTSRELSDGFATILIILTSLMAAASRVPEAQMTETEVKAISIPLANIVERSKYNKMIGMAVVGKSDYLTLGYALFTYINRVSDAQRERRNNAQPSGTSQQNTGNGNGAVGGFNAGNIGVPLRVAPSGLRGYTGNA